MLIQTLLGVRKRVRKPANKVETCFDKTFDSKRDWKRKSNRSLYCDLAYSTRICFRWMSQLHLEID
jgi:hypothetical protein